MEIGDNLSNIQNLDFVKGMDEEDLKNKLSEFKLPTKILSIYSRPNGQVVAWVLTQHKLIKTDSKIKKKKE